MNYIGVIFCFINLHILYVLWVCNATFNNIQLFHGSLFYCWRNLEYQKKTTVTEKLDSLNHLRLYW